MCVLLNLLCVFVCLRVWCGVCVVVCFWFVVCARLLLFCLVFVVIGCVCSLCAVVNACDCVFVCVD